MRNFLSLLIFVMIILNYSAIAQTTIYVGLDAGASLFIPPPKSIDRLSTFSKANGVWGLLLGLETASKWQIETGYFGTNLSHAYQYQISTSPELSYRKAAIVSVGRHGDAFPLRIKKKVDFTFLNNNYSILPSVGAVLVVLSKVDKSYLNLDNSNTYSYGLHDTVTIETSRQIISTNRIQPYLEMALTLQTPFIIKPLSIFMRYSYSLGFIPVFKTKVSYQTEENNMITDGATFNFSSRMSYLNGSVGFLLNVGEFRKAY